MTKSDNWQGRFWSALVLLGMSLAISSCTTGPPPPAAPVVIEQPPPPVVGGGIYKVGEPYQIAGVWYYPRENTEYDETGIGSWYGAEFDGRVTANGEIFDRNAITAAHPTLPMPVNARVTNLKNGRSLVVRINDRGPFVNDRVIDLSEKAADLLGYRIQGTARVRVTYLGRAELNGYGTLSVGEATPPEVANAVPAAPTSVVATNALSPVPGSAVAAARTVEALPRPEPQQEEQVSSLPVVDGVVVQMAGYPPTETYTPAVVPPAPSVQAPPQQTVQQVVPEASPAPDAVAVAAVSTPLSPPPAVEPSESETNLAGAGSQIAQVVEPPLNETAATANIEVPSPVVDSVAAPTPSTQTPPALAPAQMASDVGPAESDSRLIQIPGSPPNEIYVQAGAFEDFANANRVASDLAYAGARISRVASEEGTIFRVLMGPFQDVVTAEAVLDQMQTADLSGVEGEVVQSANASEDAIAPAADAEVSPPVSAVVAATTPPIEAPAQPASPQVASESSSAVVESQAVPIPIPRPTEIFVQAGAFSDFTNANRVASTLAFVGARISRVLREEGAMFRVLMGPFEDAAAADAVLGQVQASGHSEVQIVME